MSHSSSPPIINDFTKPGRSSSTSLPANGPPSSSSSSLPPPLPSRDRGVGAMAGMSKSSSSLLKQPSGVVQSPDQLDVYYAHLQKHVRVVKRKNPYFMPIPARGNFQKISSDGTASTDWLEYLKAWVHYIIQSAASDRIDDQLEPFSYEIMKSGCDRLYRLGMPLMEPMQNMVRIYEWQNVPLTGGIFSAYLFLWWMDLLAVSLCIGLALFVTSVRLQSFVVLGMEAMGDDMDDDDSYDDNQSQKDSDTLTGTKDEDSDDNDGDGTLNATGKAKKNKNKKNWRKRFGRATSDIFTLSYSGCEASSGTTPAPESKSVKEWRTEITTNYGPTAQLLVLDIVDKLERMKNLVTWKRPAKTRALLILLVFGAFGLFYVPYGYITKSLFFWIGMEFFVLQYLRTTYPRYRRLFNIIDWILWGVPNDAQYAMEVIRLSRHSNPFEQNDVPAKRQQQQQGHVPSSSPSSSSSSLPLSTPSSSSTQQQHQQQSTVANQQQDREIKPFPGDRSASLPELPSVKRNSVNTDNEEEKSNDGNDNSIDSSTGERKKYGKAISTTATLATMMASTAVGQFKQLIDDKLEKDVGDKDDEKKPAPATKYKNCLSYGCMYQGSIPGRLFILEKGFQFRSSRLTGSKIFVDFDWQDLVSVRKTKSMDAFVFHTNGLDIHLSDGQVLSFDNVIKRDECFTNLVSSGEHW
ncbi:hypothetical protein BCR42DRAFT_447121 [Absidia repens]|uniref:GRAM domain-containing protein n=1 Tax=Absidia repens TaxID=90262 RepID=A0A1X2IWL6_9FUNG|nr:hypothetical protein BCR42DRAFT_447121 [Absidia repens]